MFLPLLSAALGIIAFLPVNFYPAGFIFLVPLFIFFLKEKSFWRLVFGAFIFRLVFSLGTVYFTLEPLTWFLSILIFLGLPVSIFLVKKLYKRFLPAEFYFYALIFSLPVFWTVFDFLVARFSLLPAYIITAGNIFGSSPFLGLAAVGGLFSLTFFAALVNTLFALLILKRKTASRKFLILNSCAIIFIILAAWQISNCQIQENSSAYNAAENSLKIATVSVNEKFDFNQFNQLKRDLAGKKTDLIIFPENIFNETGDSKFLDFYKNLAKELNTYLLATFGTSQNNKRYNSTVLFNNSGEIAGIYNKNQLTFMGEYWPFGEWHPFFYDWLKKSNPEFEDYIIFNPQNSYSRGDKKLFSIEWSGNAASFASLICLEIHYPANLKNYKNGGAQFIVNPSGNRWLISSGSLSQRVTKVIINHFLYLTANLKRIEAVWLEIPIITSGVKDFAGIIASDGKTSFVNYESENKNYGLLFGEIRY